MTRTEFFSLPQADRNQRRATVLFVQAMTAKTKKERKALGEKRTFWSNQARMARAIAANRSTKQPA